MPGSTGKTWLIVQYAWHLRGSLDKNTGFSSLGHTFRLCIDTLYSSIHVGRNLSTAEICMLVKHQTSKIAFCCPHKIVHHLFLSFPVSLAQ